MWLYAYKSGCIFSGGLIHRQADSARLISLHPKVLSEHWCGDLTPSWRRFTNTLSKHQSLIVKSQQTYISHPVSTMFGLLIPGRRCLTDPDPVSVPEPPVPNQYIFSFMALPFFTHIIIFLLPGSYLCFCKPWLYIVSA
jgi:hypothetical protein